MVNFESDEYKALSKSKKMEKVDELMKKASEKDDDINFKLDLLNAYKTKLQSEKTKLMN